MLPPPTPRPVISADSVCCMKLLLHHRAGSILKTAAATSIQIDVEAASFIIAERALDQVAAHARSDCRLFPFSRCVSPPGRPPAPPASPPRPAGLVMQPTDKSPLCVCRDGNAAARTQVTAQPAASTAHYQSLAAAARLSLTTSDCSGYFEERLQLRA